ncbi:succinate dehydrogenase/fumarate reductase iron-sulfur subunit [Methanohalophilus portucalensis]|uniref:succinate dehydrogenase n=2 Tax=Methanohalophilus portucalensis TaxID=39664 RepID=A0A1L9C7B6_9EURY|nr:succinate dehydrogenase/fumarate reductase iron-sulfur subunit [Methanohalophilus portucalensis]ATU09025.1 succinate dehydrogenase [Methanohalophilus portucalensis]OJH50449.1 succinate dehydrogenase and fumarate reductase iron-sulfur protein [Methanohalophilus portucalensis FDF-1]RNI11125.1 succinate dehydrogenase/fumarate reductase iron-sulfur subunit [Methanohalophilus portucalensis FDF-1]SMH29895.1 succinate dehydrogenase / fumarate reductase iron-sulfur subunit [Methanohalophilus portuca
MVYLKIKRQDESREWYDSFEIEETAGMTVLEALFYVQEHMDGSLCFRYACRGAVCGSCGMLINRVPRLACRTQVGIAKKENTREGSDDIFVAGQKSEAENEVILIEPLSNLEVIRDLIVDMDTFYNLVDSIKPWINSPEQHPEGGNLVSPDLREKIEKYTNCILCACCHGACPVAARDDTYLSPATLAKAWRMHLDPRENNASRKERLDFVDSESGVWGCDLVYKCVAVCPKKVPPTMGIKALREQIEKNKEN